MNDERAIAAAIHAGLQSDDVTDLYTGDCRGCGECCSRFLPVSPFDRVRLEAYVRRNGIEPAKPRAEYDLLCPYLTDGRECAVYAARPEICRAYRCDRHKRGELGMFFGAECAEVTDMRSLAESMARDVYQEGAGEWLGTSTAATAASAAGGRLPGSGTSSATAAAGASTASSARAGGSCRPRETRRRRTCGAT